MRLRGSWNGTDAFPRPGRIWATAARAGRTSLETGGPRPPLLISEKIKLPQLQGVDLEPHNLFDYNPLGGPSRSQCQ